MDIPARVVIRPGRARNLLADPELADDLTVPVGVGRLKVVQQPAPLGDEHQESAARAVVLLVRLEMLSQLADTLAENSDLDLGAARIRRMGAELMDDISLFSCFQHCG